MKFLNLDRSDLRSAKFVTSSHEQQGVWINLLGWCADQENGGRIADCRNWPENIWPTAVGVRFRHIKNDSPLWRWEGNDLVVEFYPGNQQQSLAAKRAGGEKGRASRWGHAKPESVQMAMPDGYANSSPTPEPDGYANGMPDGRKGKGKGKEREEEGEREAAPPSHPVSRLQIRSQPRDLEEAVAVGAGIGLGREDVEGWFRDCEASGWRNGRGELFQNWPREMTYHRDRLRQRQPSPANGALAKTKIPVGILLKRLEDEAIMHPGNPESAGKRSDDRGVREQFRELQQQIRELKLEISKGGTQ